MSVKPTSKEAYRRLVETGRARTIAQRVFAVLYNEQVPMTRRQIAKITEGRLYGFRLTINAIPAATRRLLEDEVIRVAYVGEDPGTGYEAEYLEVVPLTKRPEQRSFEDFASGAS